jgi:protein-S-isoprenylcysteine O-methyltransferase Ste14
MSRLWIAVRSIVYAALFLAAWGSVGWMCHGLDKEISLRLPVWLVGPGVVLGMAGAALALTTIVYFILEGRGTPAVFDPPKKFVPHGPYRLVRNPMYIGGVSMLLGWGFWLKSVSMVVYALVVFLLIHTFVVLVEEPGLRRRFGQPYEDCCRDIPRWIPRFTRPHPPI